jgi:hypothetical protein
MTVLGDKTSQDCSHKGRKKAEKVKKKRLSESSLAQFDTEAKK